jgi:UDP-N-acetylmuramate: L-alanyl-gamma-D-glutamyl-meso-diaminopimelate ligase
MHIFREMGMDFDYLVGAQLEGFDVMVRLSDTAPLMIFEGDEYLTSALDPRPKFHLYKPHIALLSGIAWDHINVFPTFENYLEQFRIFIDKIEGDGNLVYFKDDEYLQELAKNAKPSIKKIPYNIPAHRIIQGNLSVVVDKQEYILKVFGDHNLANMQGALEVCNCLKIPRHQALKAMESFKGAARRLELLGSSENTSVFTDFAHAPSKLLATVNALKKQFPDRRLVACIELHTYSSLSKEFLKNYRGTLDDADQPVVYYNPHALKLKKLPPIEPVDIMNAFANPDLLVFNDSDALKRFLLTQNWENASLLMMSSGDFDGTDLKELSATITR